MNARASTSVGGVDRRADGDGVGNGDVERDPGGWWFWVGLVVGWATMAFGLRGVLDDHDATNPAGLARWVLGGAVAHDAVVAPLVLLVGTWLGRWLPASVRGPVRGALVLTAIVVVYSYPLLRGFGRRELNASTLPGDYPTSVAMVVGLIWSASAALVALRALRRRR